MNAIGWEMLKSSEISTDRKGHGMKAAHIYQKNAISIFWERLVGVLIFVFMGR